MSVDRIAPPELNAFVDGELELARQLELEARLAADAPLRAEVDGLRGLRDAVRLGADYHVAPPALRARLHARASAPASTQPIGWRRWFAWRPLLPALAVAGLLVWALDLTLWQPGHDARLMQEAIASHVRSSVGERLVDVASSDQHTVKPWLSARLDFSPPLAEVPVAGVSLIGGRVDYLDGRPVAALVYRLRQHVIDVYVWPTAQADAATQSLSQRGFNGLHWTHGGMRFWLVSDLNREELAAFAQALARTDAGR